MSRLSRYVFMGALTVTMLLGALDAFAFDVQPAAGPPATTESNPDCDALMKPDACASLPTKRLREQCGWQQQLCQREMQRATLARQRAQQTWAMASPKPKALLCMPSIWDRWYLRVIWWVWAQWTGAPYPHPPVWKWLDNTAENFNQRLPDYMCARSPIPQEAESAPLQ